VRSKLARIAQIFFFFSEYAQDMWLFMRYNGHCPMEARERRLSYKTIIDAHTIEKGLSLPQPKPHFGLDKIAALLSINEDWTPPKDDLSRSMLVGALRDYQSSFANVPAPDTALAEQVKAFVASHDTYHATGGVRHGLTHPAENSEAVRFLESRFSARDFGNRALTDEELTQVVILAQRAPSQCNRQSARLHVYRDPAKVSALLDLQGGARGFAEAVPTLFVVTSEITAWGGPQQRNQPYLDGGLYAMMLMLSLDAKGFLSCPLNLAIGNRIERAIKRAGDIPTRERLVVMIAAGRQPDHPIRAANSPRRNARATCRVHD